MPLSHTDSSSRRSLKTRLWTMVYAIHKWAGLVTGALFLVIAITGTLMIFLSELNLRGHRAIDPGAPITHYAPALADLVARHPGSVLTSVYVPAEQADRKTWQIFLRMPEGRGSYLLADLDPTTGLIVAERDYDKTAMRFILKLHYAFLAGTPGELAAWAVSLALVVLSVSGFWIYRGAIRDLFRWRVKRVATTRSNTAWLHKWTGLWALALALIWGVTGFLYMLEIAPRAFRAETRRAPVPTDDAALRAIADLPAMHALAQQQFPDAALVSVRPILRAGQPAQVSFRYLFREAAPWHKFGEVIFDASVGTVAKVSRPEERPFRDKYFNTLATLHFGFYGGRLMQAIWGLGGLVMIFLPISGYTIWWLKRRKTSRGRPATSQRPALRAPAVREFADAAVVETHRPLGASAALPPVR